MWSQIKSWWRGSSQLSGATEFEVGCDCGEVVRGWRKPTHQVLRCLKCGAALFVLPSSPLPPVGAAPGIAPVQTPAAAPSRRRWFLWSAVVLGLAGAALLTVYALVTAPAPTAPLPTRASLLEQIQQADRHMALGEFALAARMLQDVKATLDHHPQLLTPEECRQLESLMRQAGLLATLCEATLEEILRHAAGTPDAEWQGEFASRFHGKAFLFDLEIRVQGHGNFEHPYQLHVGAERAALVLDDLQLLHGLPLHPSTRVVFLARLRSVRREPERGWMVRLEPASGVLLTHATAARVCCPALGAPQAQLLLERQKAWHAEGLAK